MSALAVGIGCASGASAAEIVALVRDCFAGLDATGARIFTPSRKADHAGLRAAAQALGLPLIALNDAEFLARQDEFCARGASPSAHAKAATGFASVAEAAALMGGGATAVLIVEKRAAGHVTCAIAGEKP